MTEFIEKSLHYIGSAFAGMIGATIAVQFHPNVNGRKPIFVFIFTGTMIAHFMTTFVADYFKIQPSSFGAVGFMLGAFGGSLFAAITKALQSADLLEFIKSKLGAKND